MRVVEAGHDRAALGVDDDGLRALEALNLAVRSDADDLVAANGHGFGEIAAAVGGVDLAVDHDQIHRAIVFALRADDETGDESHPDNESHGISREAGRHWQILACFERLRQLPCQHLRMRFAILGSGAVGGYFGAKLAKAGQDVTFIARGAHLEAIRSQGSGGAKRQARRFRGRAPRPRATPREIGPVDVAIVSVKAYDNATALPMLKPLIGPETVVLTLQNGVDSVDEVAAIVGERTCSAARPTWRRRSKGRG